MTTRAILLLLVGLLGSSHAGGVGAAARPPLHLVWPTAVMAERDGSLLVVENGRRRVVRVDPASGHVTVLAAGLAKPFAAVRETSGAIVVSDDTTLVEIGRSGRRKILARAADQIGPVALRGDGNILFATQTKLFELRHGGAARLVAGGLSNPHGLAVARGGAVLVADTGHGRVLRIGAHTTEVLLRAAEPRGLAVATDGSIFVVEGAERRVIRLGALGERRGFLGPAFDDPYAVAVGADGSAYVLETAQAGWIVRLGGQGQGATTVPTG